MNPIQIENIADLRRRNGIDDTDLQLEINNLRAKDHVKLTLIREDKPSRSETILVRITSIKGPRYRGQLTQVPLTLRSPVLHIGTFVTFQKDHIHSIPKECAGKP